MGTRFEILIGDGPAERWRPAGEAAIDVIDSCHRRFSRFEPASLLSHIQRTGSSSPVRLDADTFSLFEDALQVHRESAGAFDITVGGLMERLGFHPAAGDDADAEISMSAIRLDGIRRTISLASPRVRLDLGAIAKGHALDLAARVLGDAGVTCALLHGGTSSIVALGAPPGTAGWGIELRHSGERLYLRDTALGVSTTSGRTLELAGRQTGHIVDPRTGHGLDTGRSVAVTGPSARLCDAWATALAVLGRRPASLTSLYTTLFHDEP